MERLWLHGPTLLDPEAPGPAPGSILIERGRIAAVLPVGTPRPEAARAIELAGAWLTPGFVDVHYHGPLATCATDDATAALGTASASLARHGVTAFLATTVAWARDELARRVEAMTHGLASGGWPGAEPLGLHLEGPWIRDSAAGAQPPDGIRPFDPKEGAALFDRAGSALRLVTLAPEIEGARGLEAELTRRNIRIALGHTLAGEDSVAASVSNGAQHVTHLFNAMGCTRHRAPVGASAIDGFARIALEEPALGCDLIADGAHVHPDWLRTAAEAKRDRTVLISDRIDVGPLESGGWLGADRMRSDGIAWRLPDGRLAGSLLTLDDAIRNAVEWRVMTLHDAIAACTVRPARLLGIERERGTLRPGARADLVVLDADARVVSTWIDGRPVVRG